jgi:hypothetical protein
VFLIASGTMELSREEALKRHSELAFQRMKAGAPLIERIHDLPVDVRNLPCVRRLHAWLLVPFSFWPVDLIGFGASLLSRLEGGRVPGPVLSDLLDLVGDPPPKEACSLVQEHEHNVQAGSYESFIRAKHKFNFKEESVRQDPAFQSDWGRIKARFDVARYQKEKGIIRRRVVAERNFHPPEWDFQWKTPQDRFRNVFDAFCHKWALYGMEWDKPLLQKLSVNVTPFGTMVFFPRYWSIDHVRDLRWRAIKVLHCIRGVPRQGVKLSANQIARRNQAEQARHCVADGRCQGLKGERLDRWVMNKLGMHPDTDRKQLRRLLKVR